MAVLKLEVKDELVAEIAEGMGYIDGSGQTRADFVVENIIDIARSYAKKGREKLVKHTVEQTMTPILDEDIKKTK